MAVGNEPGDQVDQEIDRAAMARMLDLTDVLELIIDGLDNRSLAQEEFVRHLKQAIAHPFAQFGDEVNPMGEQEFLHQGLGEVDLIAKELAEEPADQFGNGASIIDVAWGQAKGQQLALIIDDQVQLKAVEPAHRHLATCGPSGKDPVLMAATAAQLRVQIGHQWNQKCGHQLDEAVIAHQAGKLTAQMLLDILGAIRFERPIVGLMEQDHYRHEFARVHLRWTQTLSRP